MFLNTKIEIVRLSRRTHRMNNAVFVNPLQTGCPKTNDEVALNVAYPPPPSCLETYCGCMLCICVYNCLLFAF